MKYLLVAAALALTLSACQPPEKNTADKGKDETPATTFAVIEDAKLLEKANTLANGASKGKISVDSIFKGPDSTVGLVVAVPGGGKDIAWANKEMTVLFPMALGADGNSFNVAAQEAHLKAPGAPTGVPIPELAKEILDKKVGFVVGTKGPIVTAVMDPNCGYCNRFYNDVMPLVKKGEVRVRFIMVGILSQDSVSKAAAILADKNPAKALDLSEKNAGKPFSGSAAAPEFQAQVQANTDLIQKAGQLSTPTLLICNKGHDVELIRGQPQDIRGFISGLDTSPQNALCSTP